jgi:hypothetical protein
VILLDNGGMATAIEQEGTRTMHKRYSEMSQEELTRELYRLQVEMKKAEWPTQLEMLKRKFYMAKAYTLNPADYPPGTYEVEEEKEPFRLDRLEGIMAWGRLGEEAERAFPISMLKRRRS